MNFDHVIKFELSRLNRTLPRRRISLEEALTVGRPQVIGRDGSVHAFKLDELKFLAEMVPKQDRGQLQLPIFIILNPKLGRGTAQIIGKVEARVIASILKKECTGDELLLYRPEIVTIRRKLPTTTQYFFKAG